ncbi:MAG: hypothetical protein ACK4M9_22650 [Anaerobacillus sp.]|uniref:hypothetical protein n=1 Tax=Anaerobacillus sp. TaxID=1872506 RepID=UPI00391CA4D0
MLIIRKFEDLANWLNENFYFEDGYVSYIKKIDESTVTLCIGFQVEGNYVAGTPKVLKEYSIIAKGVKNFENKFKHNPEHCIEGITHIETNCGLGIEIDLPQTVQIYCEEICVEEPRYIQKITKPWVSDNSLYAEVYGFELPKPVTWIEKLSKMGLVVSWRYGGSKIKLPEQVPYPDYSGWFLQETSKFPYTQFGVLIEHVQNNEVGFSISINKYDAETHLWVALTKVIAEFSNVEIHTGNCQLTGAQWINYLHSGELPY